jgi:ELWxxDGT repeat protein
VHRRLQRLPFGARSKSCPRQRSVYAQGHLSRQQQFAHGFGRRTGNPVESNGLLFFIADDGTHGKELWRTDGTTAGTFMVKDIFPGPNSSNNAPVSVLSPLLVNSGGILFFPADDGAHGRELWRSDGTEAGTYIVKEIFPGTSGANPDYLADVGGTLFFAAQDPLNGIELWRSDGTIDGTRLIKDIGNGFSSSPRDLVSVGGTQCFFVASNEFGRELWRSDGTTTGTFMVKDIFPFTSSSAVSPWLFIDVGGILFFQGNDGNGYRPWRSDGTPSGTYKIVSSGMLCHARKEQLFRFKLQRPENNLSNRSTSIRSPFCRSKVSVEPGSFAAYGFTMK